MLVFRGGGARCVLAAAVMTAGECSRGRDLDAVAVAVAEAMIPTFIWSSWNSAR